MRPWTAFGFLLGAIDFYFAYLLFTGRVECSPVVEGTLFLLIGLAIFLKALSEFLEHKHGG